MTTTQRMENDLATISRRDIADKVITKSRIKNDEETSERRVKADIALEKNRLRPFFEDAFASAELSAKSVLLALPDKKILTGRNHKERLDKFRNWADLGNVKIEFSKTLSKLSSLRDSARYLYSKDYKQEDPTKIINILGEMIDFAEESIK